MTGLFQGAGRLHLAVQCMVWQGIATWSLSMCVLGVHCIHSANGFPSCILFESCAWSHPVVPVHQWCTFLQVGGGKAAARASWHLCLVQEPEKRLLRHRARTLFHCRKASCGIHVKAVCSSCVWILRHC